MNNGQPSDSELIGYITYSGESDGIDAKGPTCWDGGVESAKLAKDIAAFANSHDGGVIVVGKEEPSPGQFVFKGVTPQQADSFETTKVAAWINNRFSPSIRLVCHRQEHNGSTFIVITIAEFDDMPVMCVKSYHDPQNAKNALLKERTIYVRNANAESAPLGCVEELRSLIGLAVRKKGDELLSTFNAMLKGRSLIEAPSDDEHFDREISEVSATLDLKTSGPNRPGAWCMWFHPGKYDSGRWPDGQTLETLVHKHAVRLTNEFPPCYRGTHPREWGIANDLYGEVWTLAQSGLFIFYEQFRENRQPYQSPWMDANGGREPPIQPGMWLEYEWNMRTVIRFFIFMSRMAAEFEPGSTIRYKLSAGPLQGRSLLTLNYNVSLEPTQCRAKEFSFSKSLSVEDLRTGWETECVASLQRFFGLFPDLHIGPDTLRKWVEKFKSRDF